MLSSLLFLAGCQKDPIEIFDTANARIVYDIESDTPFVQFLSDVSDSTNQGFQNQIRKTTTYTKIPYARVSIKNINEELELAPSTRVLVITNTKPIQLKAFKKIISFVSEGGTLVLPVISEDPKYAFLAGLTPNAAYTSSNIAKGFHFKTNFLPGMKDISYDNKTVHSALVIENFIEEIKILATASNDDSVPTIVQNKLGSGKVIVINSSLEARKQDRGLYFAAILSGLDNVPYPIANTSTIFIDDFPAPTYSINRDPIKLEYNLDETTFYRDIWWPDMVTLAKEQQVTYTAMVCFDYRNLDTPPFLFTEWEASTVTIQGAKKITGDLAMQKVLKQGDELGLHGYNHISLMTAQWENPDFMELALQAAQKKWRSGNYGPLPKTYVPPSNDIDSLGLAAIAKAFPSLAYNSSLYLGDFNYGGEREFDVEPLNDHFFDFPRITSGYTMDSGTQFDLQSLYLYTGVWTHFIHPDDVYQIPDASNSSSRGNYEYRNNENLNWKKAKDGKKGMLPLFKDFLTTFKKQYPMLRSLQAQEAAALTRSWRNKTISHNVTEASHTATLSSSKDRKDTYWFIYNKATTAATFEKKLKEQEYSFSKTEILEGYLYQIKTTDAVISIPISAKKTITKTKEPAHVTTLLKRFDKYTSQEPEFKSVDEEIAYLEGQGILKRAIELLEQKIIASNTVDTNDYKLLYQFYSWNNQEEPFYNFLENQYSKSPSEAIVALSKTIADANEYPSNALRKLWLERQMKHYPNNVDLQNTYLEYFGTEKELEALELAEVEKAFTNSPTAKEKAALLPRLLAENSTLLSGFLKSSIPCENSEYNQIAHSIAQYYADDDIYDKALAWSQCTNKISAETINLWRLETGEYQFLKNSDFKKYIEVLIEKDPTLLTQELINIEPCAYDFETDTLTTIAYAFADQGSYRSAYQWSSCIESFDVTEQLQWLANMRAIDEMELLYAQYIKNNANTTEVTLQMATRYSELGEISKAWKLASSLADVRAEKLRIQLNKDVLYIPVAEQKELLATHSAFFYPEVAQQLTKLIRIEQNDFLISSSNLLADRLQPTSLTNEIGYGHYSRIGNQHVFGVAQNSAYALRLDTEEVGNTPLNLLGAYYSFKTREREQKPTYSARAGLEYSDTEKLYYQAEIGIAVSKDSLFSSAQLSFKPAITAPAYTLDIYRMQLSVYEEYRVNTRWHLTAALEGNYYTDNVVDGLLSTRLKNNYFLSKKSTLSPYAEGAGMLGSTNYIIGYPYWTIEERLYGGIGLGYSYKVPRNELFLEADAATFFDTFSGTFQRYRGTASLPLFDYFFMNFNAEFFTLENFYSNSFTLGLKYHFK